MHAIIITRNIEEMAELFDIAIDATKQYPNEAAMRHTVSRIKDFKEMLKDYVGRELDMKSEKRVESVFDSFQSLRDKFNAYITNFLKKTGDLYTTRKIVADSVGALDEATLASHVSRECIKRGMMPWAATCATNSVLEKQVIKLEESESAYQALRKAGKIQQ